MFKNKNMKKILLLFLAFICTQAINSQTTRTAQSGINNWNSASSWSPSGVPASNDNILVPDGAKIKVNVANVTIDYFVIQSGGTLEVNNEMTVTGGSASSNAGNLTLKESMTISASNFTNSSTITLTAGKKFIFSNASSDLTNNGTISLNSSSTEFSSMILKGDYVDSSTGSITYVRYISGVSSSWDLIGSAVVGEVSDDIIAQSNLATNSDDFGIGTYDNQPGNDNTSGNGSWSTFDSDDSFTEGTLESGKGFQMATTSGATINFSGTYLDGNATFAITEGDSAGDAASVAGTRFNLVANPYPAYISVNSNASGAAAQGTDYVLNTDNANLLHANNKAVYVWAGTGNGYTTINSLTSAADAVIAPGQGFMVGGNYDNSGSITFNRNMMTEDGSDDAINGDIMDNNDRAELFINLHQENNNRRAEIYFTENTSDSFESGYDAASLGFDYPSINTRLVEGDEGVDFSIQGLAYSEMWDKVIPLAINALGGDEMTIGISHRTTPADLNIYLEDTQQGTMTNLLDGDYVLTPTSDLSGVGRFFIHMSADTMSNEEVSTSMLNAYKEIDASYITIEGLATQSNETKVSLYNILGREVLSTTLNNNMGTQTISTVGLSAGIYVIELESGTDRLTKKLLIQ